MRIKRCKEYNGCRSFLLAMKEVRAEKLFEGLKLQIDEVERKQREECSIYDDGLRCAYNEKFKLEPTCQFYEGCMDYLKLCQELKDLGMVTLSVQNALDTLNRCLEDNCYSDNVNCAMYNFQAEEK